MKRRSSQAVKILIILGIIAFVAVYIIFFNGTGVYISTGHNKSVIMKVDGDKTDVMQANILLANAKTQYESVFGEDVWSQTVDGVSFEDYVKDKVKTELIRVRCMNLMAEKKGVVLSRTDKENIGNAVDEFMAGLTDDQIEELGVTEEKLTTMFTEFAIAKELYSDMTSTLDIEVSSDDARVITIQYISTSSEDDINDAKTRLDNGESFYTVAKEYNGNDDYECELKRGEMDSAFETAAFNLKTGETSDIVEADGNYYIIKCTSDNEKAETEANKEALIEQKKLDAFNDTFESYEASKYIDWNTSVWKQMKVSTATSISVNFEDILNSYFE